jgi:hypothetical protein
VMPAATVSVPLAAPGVVGEKVTEIVQLAAGDAQVWVETAKPAPTAVGLSATREPVLVTVTLLGGLT